MPSRSGLSAADAARDDFIYGVPPPAPPPGAPPPGAPPPPPSPPRRGGKRRGGWRRWLFDAIVEVARDGARRGHAVRWRKSATANEISRARHHQAEIGGCGAAPIARVHIGVFGGRRTAPIGTRRQGYRVAADPEDRVVCRDCFDRPSIGDDAVGEKCARQRGGTLLGERRGPRRGDCYAIGGPNDTGRHETVEMGSLARRQPRRARCEGDVDPGIRRRRPANCSALRSSYSRWRTPRAAASESAIGAERLFIDCPPSIQPEAAGADSAPGRRH